MVFDILCLTTPYEELFIKFPSSFSFIFSINVNIKITFNLFYT